MTEALTCAPYAARTICGAWPYLALGFPRCAVPTRRDTPRSRSAARSKCIRRTESSGVTAFARQPDYRMIRHAPRCRKSEALAFRRGETNGCSASNCWVTRLASSRRSGGCASGCVRRMVSARISEVSKIVSSVAATAICAFRPSTEALVAQLKSRERGRFRPECNDTNSGPPRGSCPGSATGNLRVEQDGLGLPLLIKGAISSRHR